MKVELITWADSQACIGCKHGALVDDEKVGSSAYICLKNLYPDYPEGENDFILCSKFEEGVGE